MSNDLPEHRYKCLIPWHPEYVSDNVGVMVFFARIYIPPIGAYFWRQWYRIMN